MSFLDGSASAAQFDLPEGITTDGTNLYVTEASLGSRIRQIDLATGEVTPLAGGGFGFSGGTGSAAQFGLPFGITSDDTHLYVADSFNNSIRRIQ